MFLPPHMRHSDPVFQLSAAGKTARAALSPARLAKWRPTAPAHGKWVHVYRDEHKRRKREVCAQCVSEPEAIAHNFELQRREAAIAEGRETRKLGTTSTWAEWSAHYRETVLPRMASQAPLLSHLRRLDAAWSSLPLAAISSRECRALLTAAERDGLASSSLRQLYGRARGVFARAVKEKWTATNPWDDIDAPEVEVTKPVTLSHAQVGALLQHAGEHRTLLLVAVLCGMRRGELGGLLWADVQLEQGAHGVIHVARSWDSSTTKSGKQRLVPVHASLRGLLLEAKSAATSPYVFPSPRTGGMRHADWKTAELIRSIAERAGVELPESQTLTFHALRRCFATFIAQATRDGVALRELMGHSDLSVTVKHYIARENVGHLESAVATLPTFTTWQTTASAPAVVESTTLEDVQKAA